MKLKIAWDIDDTLIIPAVATGLGRDTPNYETIAIYKWFQKQGHQMILWSGGGVSYAKEWGEKLGLQPFIALSKTMEASITEGIDIAFDDCEVLLGVVNVKVDRLNNSISRGEWNKHKNE